MQHARATREARCQPTRQLHTWRQRRPASEVVLPLALVEASASAVGWARPWAVASPQVWVEPSARASAAALDHALVVPPAAVLMAAARLAMMRIHQKVVATHRVLARPQGPLVRDRRL